MHFQMPSPATTGESSDGGSGGGSPFIGARDLLKRRRSYEEHRSFLESFSRYREVKGGNGSEIGQVGSVGVE